MADRIRIGLVQPLIQAGNVSANLERGLVQAEACVSEGATILFLPELFNTGYFLGDSLIKCAHQGFDESLSRLTAFCRHHRISLLAGLAEPSGDGGLFNSVIVIDPDGCYDLYRKTHLHGRELDRFRPGQRLDLFQVQGVKFGVLSCYEADLPEVARTLVLQGAEVLFIAYALVKNRGHVFELFTQARAFENRVFLVASSQTGIQDEFEFYGHSRVVSPRGEVICDMGEATGHITFELDLSQLQIYRKGLKPGVHLYFPHRRPELYEPICEPRSFQELADLGLS